MSELLFLAGALAILGMSALVISGMFVEKLKRDDSGGLILPFLVFVFVLVTVLGWSSYYLYQHSQCLKNWTGVE